MRTINYPLLYFEMENKSTYGMLVGTDYQAVDKNLRGVKNSINQHLQKDYKKFDYYPMLEITEPKMKIMEVSVRPTYKEKTGSFPMSKPFVYLCLLFMERPIAIIMSVICLCLMKVFIITMPKN